MPGLYQPGEYDVAGFAVGSVKQDRVIDGKQIQEGDVLIALPSSGLHSNGFSLVRKVVEASIFQDLCSRECDEASKAILAPKPCWCLALTNHIAGLQKSSRLLLQCCVCIYTGNSHICTLLTETITYSL